MSSYTNIFGNYNVQPALASYASYTFAVDLNLTWPLQFVDTTNVVANVIDLNPTVGGLLVHMPDATQVSVGQNIIFFNVGAFTVTIRNGANEPLNPIATIAAGGSVFIYLRNNSTVAGTWGSGPFGQGAVSVTSINAISASNNLVIGGVPITTTGTITFALANDLLALSTFGGGTGIAARTAANTWFLRTLTGTANQILIANPDGIGGNPTFSLSPVITGINNLTAGNININGNTISTTNANGNLILNPNGTGNISIAANAGVPASLVFQNPTNNGYVGLRAGNVAVASTLVWTLPLVDGTAGQILQTNGAAVLGWASAVSFTGASTNNAIAKYNGIGGTLQNSGVIIDAANNITGSNSIITQNIRIGVTDGNTINISNANGSLNLVPNGIGEVNLVGNTTARPVAGVASGIFFDDGASANFVGLVASNALASTVTYTLPNAGATIAGQFLTSTVPVANASTMSWASPAVLQVVRTTSTTLQNSVVVGVPQTIPLDSTIPQIGEGVEAMNVTITPKAAGILIVEFSCPLYCTDTAGAYAIFALFQNPSANALNATAQYAAAANAAEIMYFRHIITPAVPNVAVTFSIRYGASTGPGGGMYLLSGSAGHAVTLGGVSQISLTITELAP